MKHTEPGMHAIVMGLGRFGGGSGVVTYLHGRGMSVLVTDLSKAEDLQDSIDRLAPLAEDGRLEYQLGTHDGVPFETADLVVASPAVPRPWNNPYLKRAQEAGVPIRTEIELLLDRIDHRKLVAVTGSAGKSSTSAMIHHLLERSGRRSLLGGNLGGSLLGCTQQELDEAEAVVLELSSFMLHWIGASNTPFVPATAVLTTLSPNHLDWHDSADHYVSSKATLLAAVPNGNLILPVNRSAIEPEMARILDSCIDLQGRSDRSWEDQEQRMELDQAIRMKIPGTHQRENAMVALMAVACLLEKAPTKRRALALELAPELDSFSGLPHRLKPLSGFNEVMVVDDSKSTTPEAAVRAVEAFETPSSIHLIAGGFDKGSDLSAIDQLGHRVAGLYAIGATSSQLLSGPNASSCETIDEAVRRASREMGAGEILLLSPGCASWDQFDNYEQRGRAFESAARTHLEGR